MRVVTRVIVAKVEPVRAHRRLVVSRFRGVGIGESVAPETRQGVSRMWGVGPRLGRERLRNDGIQCEPVSGEN